MTDGIRSLTACLRCRRRKLRCSGPDSVPCERCSASASECTFVAPRAAPRRSAQQTPASSSFPSSAQPSADRLEARFSAIESRHQSDIGELKLALRLLTERVNAPPSSAPRPSIVSASDWQQLYGFFMSNCVKIISILDDAIYADTLAIQGNALMSIVICTVAARAIMPNKYQTYLEEASRLLSTTFFTGGAVPDLLTVQAVILLTAYTGNCRLLGYAVALASELGLETAARILVQAGEAGQDVPEETATQARTWLSLCCFDLVMNLDSRFFIGEPDLHYQLAQSLCASAHTRPVDTRICTYLEGLRIAAQAKERFPSPEADAELLDHESALALMSLDEQVDGWFYTINNTMNPYYQTFPEKQRRNRFLLTYCFLKIYINGYVLRALGSSSVTLSPSSVTLSPLHVTLLQRALDSSILCLRTQSSNKSNYLEHFCFSVDYQATTTRLAVKFISRAMHEIPDRLQPGKLVPIMTRAAHAFAQARAVALAAWVQHELQKLPRDQSCISSVDPSDSSESDDPETVRDT